MIFIDLYNLVFYIRPDFDVSLTYKDNIQIEVVKLCAPTRHENGQRREGNTSSAEASAR